MGEMIEFPSNGSTAGGYLAAPEGGSGPGRDRDPGVVGPGRPHQGRLRPLRRRRVSSPWPPTSTTARRCQPGEPDEAGKAMMAMQLDQAGRDMSGAVDELLRRSSRRQGRRHRVLHGRRAGPGARHAATRRRGGRRAVLRHHPVARRAARLLGHDGRGARPLRREGRLLHPGGGATRWRSKLRGLGKSVEIIIYPGADHAFFNDTRPEVYDADAAPRAVGAHAGVLPRAPPLSDRAARLPCPCRTRPDPAGSEAAPEGPRDRLLPLGHVRTLP